MDVASQNMEEDTKTYNYTEKEREKQNLSRLKNLKGDKEMISYSDGKFRNKGNKIEYRFYNNNIRYSIYGKTKEECFLKRNKSNFKQKKKTKTSIQEIIIFAKWLEEWYLTYKKPFLKSTYIIKYEYYINKIKYDIGDIDIKKISELELQKYINSIKGKEVPKKIKNIIIACLEKAEDLELISKNKAKKLVYKREPQEHRRPIQFDEQDILVSKIKNINYLNAFYILCCTGMRIGEFCALNFKKDINYKYNIISVKNTMDRDTKEITSAKTYTSKREIPFTDKLIPYLKHFENNSITYYGIRLYFSKLYKKLNLEKITTHSFRHTFISVCYHIGISDKQIQAWVGHASIETTLNVYTHILKNGKSKILDYLLELKKLTKQNFNQY